MRKWIIVCALVGTVAHAAPPPQALPQFSDRDRKAKLSTAFADIDRLFAEFAKTAHVPGAAWGIVIDGELAHSGSAGVRDVASERGCGRRHGLPHRVDDEELHGDGDPEAPGRGQAVARRSGRALRAGAEGPALSDDGLSEDHDPASALAFRGVSRGQPVGRSATRGYRGAAVTHDAARAFRSRTLQALAYEYSNYGFAILGRIVSQASREAVRRLHLTEHPSAARHDVHDAASVGGGSRTAALLDIGGKTNGGKRNRRCRMGRSARWAGC